MLDVWTATEIFEGILLVCRNLDSAFDFLSVFIYAAGFKAIDQFEFVDLAGKEIARFISTDDAFFKGKAAANDLPHAFFDRFKIFR